MRASSLRGSLSLQILPLSSIAEHWPFRSHRLTSSSHNLKLTASPRAHGGNSFRTCERSTHEPAGHGIPPLLECHKPVPLWNCSDGRNLGLCEGLDGGPEPGLADRRPQ